MDLVRGELALEFSGAKTLAPLRRHRGSVSYSLKFLVSTSITPIMLSYIIPCRTPEKI